MNIRTDITCHAEGDRCHGCDHYHGRAAVCTYAPTANTEPVAWVKSSEWDDAKKKRQSFNGWRQNYGDCDIRLYHESALLAERERANNAESNLASLADTIASARRNINPFDDPVIDYLGDMREEVWKLSYAAYNQRQRAEQAERERAGHWEEEARRYCCNSDYWRERAEKAEAQLAALKEALRNPTDDMVSSGLITARETGKITEVFKAMTANLLKD